VAPASKQKSKLKPNRPVEQLQSQPQVLLPAIFAAWFASRGWQPRVHQLALLDRSAAGLSTLLIAPTGAGKTLAGFLPSLVDLMANQNRARQGAGLHTLYISPLKALAVDVARNLTQPVAEMGLPVRIETRTSDTSVAKRTRQRSKPPDILLTTPEQIALLISHSDAAFLFRDLKFIVLDELHALSASKRGDLLALGLARLRTLSPGLITIGLSATVARPSELRAYLVPQTEPDSHMCVSDLVITAGGVKPHITILESDDPLPWSGHTARYAIQPIYDALKAHKLSLLFVNTRSQAEILFQELWKANDDNLAIALHHGSLDMKQRQRVETAMAQGLLKAVVCTSTLDLGIDWGDVDLVINVGAPKGASRLIQRIGRANHRLDEPSRAILVPANRFEVLECRAALDAAEANVQDVQLARTGAIDVLCQHVMGIACAGPFQPAALYDEVRTAAPYSCLSRADFDRALDFVATGGYALRAYDRFAKLRPTDDGALRLAHPRLAQAHRMNVGTIVDSEMLKVRLVGRGKRGPSVDGRPGRNGKPLAGGRALGQMDEWWASEMSPGDTFVFAGEILRLEGIVDSWVYVSRSQARNPKIPSYPGGKFPLSTHLAGRVRAMLADDTTWPGLPLPVREWLGLQAEKSALPSIDEILVETFPRADRHYIVAYPFEGRLAHQTLGMLLTRRLERARARPLGFVATDYGLSIWAAGDLSAMIADGRLSLSDLFAQDMLGDDLDAWLAESSLMKRTFRTCAVIAGLIERRHPGKEKSGRQLTVSTNLIYDVLRRHDPHHILLEAAWSDAATGLLDIKRLADFLGRVQGHINHVSLSRVSPLSVPILLEIGREPVFAAGGDGLLRDAADALIAEAMGE
jgi:ATP-dependent helicase Lhr and Lhr-like helicase